MKVRTFVLGPVALACVVACGGSEQRPSQVSTTSAAPNDQYQQPQTTSQQQTQPTTNGNTVNGQTSSEQGMGSVQQQGSTQTQTGMFNDSQIIAIVNTAHDGEIEQAKLALQKAKNPQVKQFAQMMIQQHGAAKNQGQQLISSMGITPEPTPTSNQLQSDAQTAMSSLNNQSGGDFDKAYIDLQVKEHKDVLDMLDGKLIPQAHNADLRKDLQDFRPKVADHLQRAENLQKTLSGR